MACISVSENQCTWTSGSMYLIVGVEGEEAYQVSTNRVDCIPLHMYEMCIASIQYIHGETQGGVQGHACAAVNKLIHVCTFTSAIKMSQGAQIRKCHVFLLPCNNQACLQSPSVFHDTKTRGKWFLRHYMCADGECVVHTTGMLISDVKPYGVDTYEGVGGRSCVMDGLSSSGVQCHSLDFLLRSQDQGPTVAAAAAAAGWSHI